MLLNSFIQDLAQIYGQIVNFHQCVRKRQSFCQMQRLTNQRAKLTVEFTAKLFWVISIIASVMHTKNRIGFATDCKSDPVFLRMHDDSHAVMEISKNSLEVNLTESLAR